jgi:hypothetical protein
LLLPSRGTETLYHLANRLRLLLASSDTRKIYVYNGVKIFFSGEGLRSRRYGRTAALRLIVQPCDGDDDNYYYYYHYYYLSFSY